MYSDTGYSSEDIPATTVCKIIDYSSEQTAVQTTVRTITGRAVKQECTLPTGDNIAAHDEGNVSEASFQVVEAIRSSNIMPSVEKLSSNKNNVGTYSKAQLPISVAANPVMRPTPLSQPRTIPPVAPPINVITTPTPQTVFDGERFTGINQNVFQFFNILKILCNQ